MEKSQTDSIREGFEIQIATVLQNTHPVTNIMTLFYMQVSSVWSSSPWQRRKLKFEEYVICKKFCGKGFA